VEFVSEQLDDDHNITELDSGRPTLDDWLRKSARDSDGRRVTRTYVWHRADGPVVAYYTLMPYLIDAADLSKRQRRGLPSQIPCFLLARLALDGAEQGQGLGALVLAEALSRAVAAAEAVGGRFVIDDAIDDVAASFYVHHGFDPVPGVEGRLLIPVKDLPHPA
jgi:GNAT superfamily N-acetyltransferase